MSTAKLKRERGERDWRDWGSEGDPEAGGDGVCSVGEWSGM